MRKNCVHQRLAAQCFSSGRCCRCGRPSRRRRYRWRSCNCSGIRNEEGEFSVNVVHSDSQFVLFPLKFQLADGRSNDKGVCFGAQASSLALANVQSVWCLLVALSRWQMKIELTVGVQNVVYFLKRKTVRAFSEGDDPRNRLDCNKPNRRRSWALILGDCQGAPHRALQLNLEDTVDL